VRGSRGERLSGSGILDEKRFIRRLRVFDLQVDIAIYSC